MASWAGSPIVGRAGRQAQNMGKVSRRKKKYITTLLRWSSLARCSDEWSCGSWGYNIIGMRRAMGAAEAVERSEKSTRKEIARWGLLRNPTDYRPVLIANKHFSILHETRIYFSD